MGWPGSRRSRQARVESPQTAPVFCASYGDEVIVAGAGHYPKRFGFSRSGEQRLA